jgi:diadenosine tetraphosphatase ApaH/serine/threonine PP2A family protein phosphatase
MGNHEHAVLNATSGVAYNFAAQKAIDWTRERIGKAGLLDRISGLKPYHKDGYLLFVHGTVGNVLLEYLVESDDSGHSTFDELVKSLEHDFVNFRMCFVGHNHLPFLATTEGFLHPHQGLKEFQVPKQERLYVSVGSVGQPRDGDPRACFVTFDGSKVTYHRVAYPFATTAEKIRSCGLPSSLAERLSTGK